MRVYWLCFFLCFVLVDASFCLETELNRRRTPLVVAAEKVSPAVVNIYTSETGRSPRNPFRDFGNNIFDQFFNDFFSQIVTSKGMVVVNVVPKSASDRTGIGSGDVIRQVNQDNIDTEEDYNKSIANLNNPDRILLLVQRGRQGYYVTLEP